MIGGLKSLVPRGVAQLFAAILCTIALGVVVEAAQPPAPTNGSLGYFGSFAGYTWHGTPTSVAANWRVPAILGNSPAGYASTWIAVQGRDKVFLQVGTVEDRFRLSNGQLVNAYSVFWSDTSVQFQPQLLENVRPGELVSVKLVATDNEWEIVAVAAGHTTGTTVNGPTNNVDRAEWIQEDPQTGLVGPSEPYPQLSTIAVSGVRVNNSVPRLSFPDVQWMSAPGGRVFGPTQLRHDEFEFQQVELSGVQREFLAETAGAYPQSDQLVRATLGLAPLATPNPEPSRAATLLVRRALAAMRAAHSVQTLATVSGIGPHILSQNFPIPSYQINEDLFSDGDLIGSDAFGGPGGSIVVVGNTAYGKFDSQLYNEVLRLPAGRSDQLSQLWLKTPKNDPTPFFFAKGLSINYSTFEQTLAKSTTDVALLGTTYWGSERVYDLATTDGLEFYLAASGTPYMMKLQGTEGPVSIQVEFNWTHDRPPQPPPSSTPFSSVFP